MTIDNAQRIEQMLVKLKDALETQEVDITDDSHLHAGHAGAKSGAGHFTVTVVSDRFDGLNPVARHRLVYEALDDMMGPDIHALAINAFTQDEV